MKGQRKMETKMETKKYFSIWSIYQKYGIIVMLILEIAIFSIMQENFLSMGNLLSVGRQISFIGITSIGMTMVLLTGGLDISVGAMLALTGVISALLYQHAGVPLVWTILITLGVGALFGTLNGVSVAYLQVPALIATLGMQVIMKGVGYVFTHGIPVGVEKPNFLVLGQGFFFEVIPIPLVIMIVLFIFGWWFLTKTYVGRHFYAVGGNEEAARLAGIKTKRLVMLSYTACGIFAAITGILMAGRMGSGQPSAGVDFPMDVLTATVLGGISLFGGKGSIINVFFGAFIMGFLTNGMVMLGVSDYWQWITKGIVLIMVVALSNVNLKKANKI
ncbi:MAG: ABC transporter permease [Ruminiclostridium sp.]